MTHGDSVPRPRAFRAGAFGLVVVAMCALAGCETGSNSNTPPAAAPAPPDPASSPESTGVVVPAAPPGPQSGAGAAGPMSVGPSADLAARSEPTEPVVNSDPERLLGMDRGALTDLLGNPTFVRKEAPAQLWRYRNDTCLLDLFLYNDDDPYRRRFTVKHYEVRGERGAKAEAEACLKDLLLARMTKPVG